MVNEQLQPVRKAESEFVPIEWQSRTLGSLAKYINGYGFGPEEWGTVGRPIIRIQNLTKTSDTCNYFDGELDNRYLVVPGDLLISWSASLDAFIWNGPAAWLNQHIFKVADVQHDVDKHFLFFALKHNINRIKEHTRGSTMKHVTRKTFLAIALNLPPLAEQRAIAHVLRTVQRAKEATEKVIEAAKQLKKSLMKHLFTYGPVPFREADKVELKETEAGLVPTHWRTTQFGEICDVRNGFAFKSDDYVEEGILNFRVVNIQQDGILDVESDTRHLPTAFLTEYSDYVLNDEDVLLVMVGATRGKIGLITNNILPALMNQNMWRVVSRIKELPQRYVYYYLLHTIDLFAKTYSEEARGFFSKTHFRTFPISFPADPQELDAILTALGMIERIVQTNQQKFNALSLLFKSLLTDLMTGQIRVHDLDLPELKESS